MTTLSQAVLELEDLDEEVFEEPVTAPLTRDNFWGELIQELRNQQQVTQRQLAAAAKVNRSTLRRIEDGTAGGDIYVIERILKYLSYDLEAITQSSKSEQQRRHALTLADPDRHSKSAATKLLEMRCT